MIILTIRTDKPEAEIGLYDNAQQLAYKSWQAHRELSATIHTVIQELLDSRDKNWGDIEGIVYYKGPGSFTGLRIGASVANALASVNKIPVAADNGERWIQAGVEKLAEGRNHPALPEYGEPPRTTAPKK